MIFEWMSDPAAWAGLATLVVLEIVLGIDNLVFIAILANRLPEHQREKARLVGLLLALAMRLVLLASIAWVVTLTQPLFTIMDLEFSGRDLILISGGLFLLFKGTMELHERLEGQIAHGPDRPLHAVFWQVIAQIVIFDAIFSLDSVITAVGMVDELSIMMIAVIIAIGVMIISSKPLMTFVSRHPTVVILCLGFLLMIGFLLVVEGFGLHIPKGYLYAAISFSILIETFNQVGQRNREKLALRGNLRNRTATAVLRLLGGRPLEVRLGGPAEAMAEKAAEQDVFAPQEKEMIQGVLTLAERPASSIMTPRKDIDWLDLDEDQEALRRKILGLGHSRFLMARGSLDNLLGVAFTRELLRDLLEEGRINPERSIRQPLVVHESVNVLRLMEQLRRSPLQLALLVDEYGSIEGIVTPTDILEAIAGDFPDEHEEQMVAEHIDDKTWLVDGGIDIRKVSSLLEVDLTDRADRYSTLAGYLLWQIGHLPEPGETIEANGLIFEVVAMDKRNIDKVRIRTTTPQADLTAP
ncbi:TerC family protein [Luteithermobacter gelatinilyticus]|uniref:TerC family protein n=1 Tax=Luteithermobacter gelatinilyticus TaxID=2582913 RepID=UPI001106CA05|nr:TerC family protein [Luteithermobacter gelatinilyticus]|tara:strand:- start:16743 stop:18317 length:1575 start_codon:yes stop_codon:yes gene_type:complete